MGLGIFCIDHLNCWLTVWPFKFLKRDGFAGIVLNISFFDATEGGDILFLQKNLQVSADVDFRLVWQRFYFYAINVT